MTERLKRLKRYFNRTLRIVLVIATTATILICFPNTGSFKYEFHKGNPWKHETLIAPFDFALYKTTKEITNEKLEILKYYKPYFSYIDSIGSKQTDNFTKHFLNSWEDFIKLSHTKSDSLYLSKQRALFCPCNKQGYGSLGVATQCSHAACNRAWHV